MAHWVVNIKKGWQTEVTDAYCSECKNKALLKRDTDMDGTEIVYALSKFCPNCGEEMDNSK